MIAAIFAYRKLIGLGLIALAFAGLFAALQVTRAKLDATRAERDLAIEQRNHWIEESDRRREAVRREMADDKPKSEQRQSARTVIVREKGECQTSPDITEALDRGWVR